jgi:anti-sigma B factor antagonist
MITALNQSDAQRVLMMSGARLDAQAAPGFRVAAIALAKGAESVILDISKVGFIDSSGVGALISLLKCIPAGGALKLVGANEAVRRLLRMTRLDGLFPTFESVAAAQAP